MTEALEYYKCNVCGNFVEIVLPGAGELVCCSQPMEKVKTQDSSEEMTGEKHVPFIQKTQEGFDIKIGSIPHPMEEQHYIQFIEIKLFLKFLNMIIVNQYFRLHMDLILTK